MNNERILVKVGGSLLGMPELPELLNHVQKLVPGPIALIFGGGKAANLVRDWDQLYQLGDLQAHRLALRALDLTAHLALEIVPNGMLAQSLEEIEQIQNEGKTPILQARTLLDQVSEQRRPFIEHSWRFTTDSIAALIALDWGANRLVLVKAIPPPWGESLPKDQQVPVSGNQEQVRIRANHEHVPDRGNKVQILEWASRTGTIDPCFPEIAKLLPRIDWINGQSKPWELAHCPL